MDKNTYAAIGMLLCYRLDEMNGTRNIPMMWSELIDVGLASNIEQAKFLGQLSQDKIDTYASYFYKKLE